MPDLELPPLKPPRPLNTDTEGVATTHPTSPTGAPRIPTAAVPWILLLAPSASAGLAAASAGVKGIGAKAALLGLSAFFGTAAGIVSQGLRKPPQE